MTTNPYLLEPGESAAFSTNRYTKADLVRGETLFAGLNCFEPGQSQPVHTHRGADKLYLVLSGKARMTVGDHRFEAATGHLIWAPAEIPHGVNEALERTVMLVVLAPPPR
ncbi:MAG: cupin domain-containing protein [Gemmatimonadales bacterium]